MTKKVGVLTAGGDAAGMNAAIRAVTRAGIHEGFQIVGIRDGYAGLLRGDMHPLTRRSVGGQLQHGGTFLGSARCQEFPTPQGQKRALTQLRDHQIDALVVIGGNGTLAGGWSLEQQGVHVVGIPATIDNDVYGTAMTLGVDTTLNIVLEAVDRIRTTASSHGRGFLIEVMGRDSGYIALHAGLAGGAEAIVIPEVPTTPEDVAKRIDQAYKRGKKHAIVIVAEGATCNAAAMMHYFEQRQDQARFAMRTTILGHVQRGGVPSAYDRLLGARFGTAAIRALAQGQHGVMTALQHGGVASASLQEAATQTRTLDTSLLELATQLAL